MPDWRDRVRAALLVLLLVVAPWLGAVHRVSHGVPASSDGAHGPSASLASFVAATGSGPAAAHAGEWTHRLFGDHGHDGDCRLFDQLCHADGGTPVSAAAVALLPPPWLQAWWLGESLVRWTALFDARGPPPTR